MTRAILDPLTMIVLLAIFLIAVIVVGYITTPPETSSVVSGGTTVSVIGETTVTIVTTTVTAIVPKYLATVECKAGPLAFYTAVRSNPDGSVYVVGYVQPPNPCYNITSVHTSAMYLRNKTLAVNIEITYSEPPPGTVCIQVLPTSTPFTIELPPPPTELEAVTVRFVAASESSGAVYTCNRTTTVTS